MTRAQLVQKLLRTCHLNVPARQHLVPPDIRFSEILAVIRDTVERERRFSSGHLTLEKLDGGAYRLHYLKYDPQASDLVNDMGGPSIPATADYQTAYAAVIALLVHLRATRDLDGIGILEFPVGTDETTIPRD